MKPARVKNTKRARNPPYSSSSEGDVSPLRKKPRSNYRYFSSDIDQSSHLGESSEDESKDDKFAKDLMSIHSNVEELQSREKEFHLKWQDQFEQFHRRQQNLYNDLKKKIDDLEHRWSMRGVKVKKVERSIDMGNALVVGASTPTSTPSTTNVRNPGLQRLKGEEHPPRFTALKKGKKPAVSTVNGPTPELHNYQSDGDENGSIEVPGDARSEHKEEIPQLGILDEDGYVQDMESWFDSPRVETQDSKQKLQNTLDTLSCDKDRARSPVGYANQPSRNTTAPNSLSRPRRQVSPKTYEIPKHIDGDDVCLPPPKETESDDDYDPNAPGNRRKSRNQLPAKGTPRKSVSGRKESVGTPGGSSLKTTQTRLNFKPTVSTNKDIGSDTRQPTPRPIKDRPAQTDKGPPSPQSASEGQPGTRPKSQSDQPFASIGVPSHLNKQQSPFRGDVRSGIIRSNSRPVFNAPMSIS